MNRSNVLLSPSDRPAATARESGKVGMAILLWMLGVPGILVLLYLLFR